VVPDEDDRVERAAVGLCQRGLGLDRGGDAIAFDVGPDHVPVADRDAFGAGAAQRLDRDQHLVGHQGATAGVSAGMGGQAVAVIVDPRDSLHIGGDQDVHRGPA